MDSSHTPLNGNVTPATNGAPGSADADMALPTNGDTTAATNTPDTHQHGAAWPTVTRQHR